MEWWQKIIQGHEQAKADKTARYRIELDQQWAKERRQEEEEKRVKRARAKKSVDSALRSAGVPRLLQEIAREVWRVGSVIEDYTEDAYSDFGYFLVFDYLCPAYYIADKGLIVPGKTYLGISGRTYEKNILNGAEDIVGVEKRVEFTLRGGVIKLPHGLTPLVTFPRSLDYGDYVQRDEIAYRLALDCKARAKLGLMPQDLQRIAADKIRELGITEQAR